MVDRLDKGSIAQVAADLGRAEISDPRLRARLEQVARRLASAPGLSFPEAMGSEADLEGAYRFVNNRRVGFEGLLAGHIEATSERAHASGMRLLVIHDTTACRFSHADPEEIGYLPTGKAGFFLHCGLVVAGRRPIGIAHAEIISRKKRSGRGSRKRHVGGTESAKWENKESARWGRGVQSAANALQGLEPIHVADREADQYELISELVSQGQRFVIRVRIANRRATDGDALSTVQTLIQGASGCVERDVPLSPRRRKRTPGSAKSHPPRNARTAQLRFSARRVELLPPRYLIDRASAPINVVVVEEQNPPDGEPPIAWMLYTSEPVETPEDVADVVDIYRDRWLIEEFNKALKTGCVLPRRQFESRDALLNVLAISLPIACQLLALRAVSRESPECPARQYFSPGQLNALRHIASRPVPEEPSVQDALWAIAGIGGHQKTNGPPGWQILQRGLEKFLAFAEGWCAHEAANM